MTEYESQHEYWKRDHDRVMAEIKMLDDTDSTWTVIRLLQNDWPMYPRWSDCYEWCIDTWGRNKTWVYTNPGTFTFKNKSDAMLFMLKWVR